MPKHGRDSNVTAPNASGSSGSPSSQSAAGGRAPALPARWAMLVERARVLDPVSAVVGQVARLVPSGPALKAGPAGHALHPFLTDIPIGFWTSSMVLDMVGGRGSRKASQRLIGLGLLSAVPTVVTGLAEYQDVDSEQGRVAAVHAGLNATAAGLYAWSYAVRRRGAHGQGVLLGLAAGMVATASGYLGGHMAFARKIGSRDEVFAEPTSATS